MDGMKECGTAMMIAEKNVTGISDVERIKERKQFYLEIASQYLGELSPSFFI
jgi:hypothetical protein